MAEAIEWPEGLTVRPLTTPTRQTYATRLVSPFSAGVRDTMRILRRETAMLEAKKLVLEMDITEGDLKIDGTPRVNARPRSPHIALTFESMHGPLRYDTEVFTRWQDNLRGIALGMESLRRVERFGIVKSGQQYQGWKALEAGATTEQYLEELRALVPGILPESPVAPKGLVMLGMRTFHPDNQISGDRDTFERIREIRAALQRRGVDV